MCIGLVRLHADSLVGYFMSHILAWNLKIEPVHVPRNSTLLKSFFFKYWTMGTVQTK